MKIVSKQVMRDHKLQKKLFRRLQDLDEVARFAGRNDIIRLLDFLEGPDRYYIPMELASGGDLTRRLTKFGKLSERDAQDFMFRLLVRTHHGVLNQTNP
jgi:serine/threonine protein kinase